MYLQYIFNRRIFSIKTDGKTRKKRDNKNCLDDICKRCCLNSRYKTPSGRRDSYCSDCKNKNTREYTKSLTKEQRRAYNLKAMYGIKPEDYQNMISCQNNKCLICDIFMLDVKHCIDHNHKTGEIRGILCSPCNQGLGQFKDNIENLLNAAKYLKDKGCYG